MRKMTSVKVHRTQFTKHVSHITHHISHIFFSILALILLSSCGWDDDTVYAPRNGGAFFLVEDSISGKHSITYLDDTTWRQDFELQAGIASGNCGDIFLNDKGLWISDTGRHSVVLWNVSKGETEKEYDLGEVVPHLICVGEKEILACDTVQGIAAFRMIKGNDLTKRTYPQGKPGIALYAAGKFYLQKGCCTLGVLREGTASDLMNHLLQDTLMKLQRDKNYNISILGEDGTGTFVYGLDPNSDQLIVSHAGAGYQDFELSPYPRQNFGSEFLNSIFVYNSVSTAPGLQDSINRFCVDFLCSRMFFESRDSLFSYDLASSQKLLSYPLGTSHLLKGYPRIISGN